VPAGEAEFLLRKRDLSDVVLVSAAAGDGGGGDPVFIPPGYGHVTINPSDHRTLVMANVVSDAFLSEYRQYEVMCGVCIMGSRGVSGF